MKGLRIPMLMNRKSSRHQKLSKVNLDDKIRFTPGKPKDRKTVENVGGLWNTPSSYRRFSYKEGKYQRRQ